MAQIGVEIPIVCENYHCENYGNLVNLVSGVNIEDLDFFYENYSDSVEHDFCPICEELGVAEDPILVSR